MPYDAFISYSQKADGVLAAALQSALHRFAKPWYRLRALDVFRDQTSLELSSSLSHALVKNLADARFFILLASPRSAASKWVQTEIDYWLTHKSTDTVLIVLTDGAIAWDDAARDFDWQHTTALARTLRGAFASEPLFLDVTWARQEEQLSLRHPRFNSAVARLAAVLHGKSLDQISGEEVRQHRRNRRYAQSAAAGLLAFAVAAGVGAKFGFDGQRRAEQKTADAERNLDSALATVDTVLRSVDSDVRYTLDLPARRIKASINQIDPIIERLGQSGQSPNLRQRHAEMLLLRGKLAQNLGQLNEAINSANLAAEEFGALHKSQPDDAVLARKLALAQEQVGDALLDRGRVMEAEIRFQEARALLDMRPTIQPQSNEQKAAALRPQVGPMFRLGRVAVQRHDWPAGMRYFLAARQLLGQAQTLQPDNTDIGRSYAFSYLRIGDVYAGIAECLNVVDPVSHASPRGIVAWFRVRALASYNEQERLLNALQNATKTAQFEDNKLLLTDLAWNSLMQGKVREASGQHASAAHAYLDALFAHRTLLKHDRDSLMWRRHFADNLVRLGNVRTKLADAKGALRYFDEASGALDGVASDDLERPDIQEIRYTLLMERADVINATGDPQRALADMTQARQMVEKLLDRFNPRNAQWLTDRQRIANQSARFAARLLEGPGAAPVSATASLTSAPAAQAIATAAAAHTPLPEPAEPVDPAEPAEPVPLEATLPSADQEPVSPPPPPVRAVRPAAPIARAAVAAQHPKLKSPGKDRSAHRPAPPKPKQQGNWLSNFFDFK